MSRPRAVCGTCLRPRQLRADDRVAVHPDADNPRTDCPGSNRLPAVAHESRWQVLLDGLANIPEASS